MDQGYHNANEAMSPSRSAARTANTAPSRAPTRWIWVAPASRRKSMAAAMLSSHAGTRSGSDSSPAESPVPS